MSKPRSMGMTTSRPTTPGRRGMSEGLATRPCIQGKGAPVMLRFYPVDEWVAFAPMPGRRELLEAVSMFNVIVAVVEDYELSYDPSMLPSSVTFLHVPVPDYTWPSLPQLLDAVRAIEAAVDSRRRVLIHCMGGRGRSATLAAAYLIHRYGVPARFAVEAVRSIRPGAVEHPGQEGVLRALELLLALGEAAGRLDRTLWEAARVFGMLAESLIHSGVAGVHWSLQGLRELTAGRARGVAKIAAEIASEGDAQRLALLEADAEAGQGIRRRVVLRSVLVGYSESLEKSLEELAYALRRDLGYSVGEVEVAEPSYY